MNKQKTEECIDLMDEQIQLESLEGHKEDSEEYRQSQIRIFNFNEIKEKLKNPYSLIDVCKWWIETYPEDVFKGDLSVVVAREAMKDIVNLYNKKLVTREGPK